MAEQIATKRVSRTKQNIHVSTDESENDSDSSTSDGSHSSKLAVESTKRKRSIPTTPVILSDDSSSDDSDNPLIRPAVKRMRVDDASDDADQVPNDSLPNSSGSHISATGDTMSDFKRDIVINVTKLSNNLSRVLAKHELSAIYDERKKLIAGKRKPNVIEVK